MAAEDMAFEQGAGTPDQLAQGEVGALNDLLPTQTIASPGEIQPEPSGVGAFPMETAGSPEFQPRGMEEEILFGEMDESAPGPVQLPAGRLPDSVIRLLPAMRAAAEEADSPESLRTIYSAIVNALDASLR